jgi:hypothetical protein
VTTAEALAVKIIAALLDLVTAEFLHGKLDEQAQIKAERDAADAAARAKFGENP